jgi:hypothetical protein
MAKKKMEETTPDGEKIETPRRKRGPNSGKKGEGTVLPDGSHKFPVIVSGVNFASLVETADFRPLGIWASKLLGQAIVAAKKKFDEDAAKLAQKETTGELPFGQ